MNTNENGPPVAEDFLKEFRRAAELAGFAMERFGESPRGHPLIVARREAAESKLSVVVSAGMHGDEPAGSLSLLRLIREGAEAEVSWTIFPLLNPDGLEAGTRENSAGADLNRDYLLLSQPETRAHVAWLERNSGRFDWAVCLHEDWEARGFYLYEMAVRDRIRPGREILAAVAKTLDPETATSIDGMPASGGLISPGEDFSQLGLEWPEAVLLLTRHASLCHTFETPSALPLGKRIEAHLAALRSGLAAIAGREAKR